MKEAFLVLESAADAARVVSAAQVHVNAEVTLAELRAALPKGTARYDLSGKFGAEAADTVALLPSFHIHGLGHLTRQLDDVGLGDPNPREQPPA